MLGLWIDSELFFFFCVPPVLRPSDFQLGAGDEGGCLFQLGFIAPELVSKCGPVRPQLDPEVLVEGAGLQDVLWGVGASVARTVWYVRQPQSVQVEAEPAVSGAQPKDHNLLLTLELVNSVCRVVVLQLSGAAPDFSLD